MDLEHLKSQKSPIFNCESCHYNTSNKKDFDKHCVTRKHIVRNNLNNLEQISPKIYLPKINICKHCNKEYKSRNGLWYHEKKCTVKSAIDKNDTQLLENSFVAVVSEPVQFSDNTLIMELIKQNQEFKEMMIEQNKTMMELAVKTNNSTTNNIKNQNNFNINMFLNEKCKDAISLEDFVNSLQINSQTAEYVGKHGFVNGITHIFMTGLKQLDVHMRPFHCTDLKRETMYVKGVDVWAKDGDINTKMMSAIKDVSTKNMKQLPVWIEENPDSKISGTDKYEEQIDIMKGMLDTDSNKEKVLKNLAKEAVIDKNH